MTPQTLVDDPAEIRVRTPGMFSKALQTVIGLKKASVTVAYDKNASGKGDVAVTVSTYIA